MHTRTIHRHRAFHRPGFSIIEAAVVIGIIALLAAVLFFALRGARSSGDIAAERSMVNALKIAVIQFKEQHKFLPPLVVDATPSPAPTPPMNANKPVIWTAADLANPMANYNGGNRYSVHSLPYYIFGALDEKFDGAKGTGYTEPNRDGSFSGRGKVFEPLMDANKYKSKRGAPRLFFADLPAVPLADRVRPVVLDYWSTTIAGGDGQIPIRYYRWIPTFVANGPDKGQVDEYNLPSAVLDPKFVSSTKAQRRANPQNFPEPSIELRDKEFAIVSAGANRLFGDEDIAAIRNALGLSSTMSDADARAQAASDNLVEVGP